MRRLRRAPLGAAAVLAGLLAASAARAEDAPPAEPAAEAWYPSGVGAVTAPVRPAGTLHVGVVGGIETDRAYLRFDLPAPASDQRVAGARLTIPLAADAGTQSPESAVVLACTVEGDVPDGGGGEPPETDCGGAPTATYEEGDVAALSVVLDVAPGARTVAVALVPGGGDAWHVAFDGRERAGGRPATLTVSLAEERRPATGAPSASPPPPPAATPTPGSPALPSFAPFPAPALDLSPPPVAAGRVIAEEAETAGSQTVTAVPAGGTVGFRYVAVFGLPLALLVIVGILGDGLTKPVRLREEAA